jgi:preprotein translocase subunit SecB
MSETTPATPAAPDTPAAPPLVVNIQYVKDLSFEVPGAPQIFTTLRAQPTVAINLDVQARRVQDGQPVFEVSLVIRAEASDPNAVTNGGAQPPPVFVAELTYAACPITRSSRCCWSNAHASCFPLPATFCRT